MTENKEPLKAEDSHPSKPVDVVIAWVDGDDPAHQKKMIPYLDSGERDYFGSKRTRFRSVNEIRYCLLSIYTFAPFVRNVYVLTDNQDPMLYDDIKKYFPERLSAFRVVDHKEVFRGYEEYLPVFNSRVIETMLWRIDGLSDNFIYFNDDTFLIREVCREDFFINNRPVLRGGWLPAPYPRVWWNKLKSWTIRNVIQRKTYQPKPSYHLAQWSAAHLAGYRWRYFCFNHIPYAISKPTAGHIFREYHDAIHKNLSYKFRNSEQFNFNSLLYHTEIKLGNTWHKKPDLIFMKPYKDGKNYIERKLKESRLEPPPLFMCVQSLDICAHESQQKVINWLEKRIIP